MSIFSSNSTGDRSRRIHITFPVSIAVNSATTSSYKFSLYSNQCHPETGKDVIIKAIFKAGFFSKPLMTVISMNDEGLSVAKEDLIAKMCFKHKCSVL